MFPTEYKLLELFAMVLEKNKSMSGMHLQDIHGI